MQPEPQSMAIQLTTEQFEWIIVSRKEHTVQPRVVIMVVTIREVNGMTEEILTVVEGDQGVGVGIGVIDAEVVAEAVIVIVDVTADVTVDDLEALPDTDDKSMK